MEHCAKYYINSNGEESEIYSSIINNTFSDENQINDKEFNIRDSEETMVSGLFGPIHRPNIFSFSYEKSNSFESDIFEIISNIGFEEENINFKRKGLRSKSSSKGK